MGKSRTADELGKEHFFIPLNLGELATTGTFLYDLLLAPSLLNFSSAYPPADHNVRDYLTGSKSRDEAYDHSCALFESLFTHTLKILLHFDNSLGYVELARAFRVAMTEGQKATGHNDFRRNFYLKVIQMAKELKVQRVRCIQIYLPEPAFTQRKERKKWFPPSVALQELVQYLQSRNEPTSESTVKGKQKQQSQNVPVVVLTFDEAHTLTERQFSSDRKEWSVFNELLEALRALDHHPLFSLFLSTNGNISQSWRDTFRRECPNPNC
jgi:hypothetical protein